MSKITIMPRKKVVPSFLCYVFAMLYIVVLVFAIVGIYDFIESNIFTGTIYVGIAAFIVLCLVLCNSLFSWFTSATLTDENTKLFYLLIDPLSNKGTVAGETKITINSINKIKTKHKDIYVYGDIKKIEAHHESHPKKIKIIEGLNNPETLNILNQFKEKSCV